MQEIKFISTKAISTECTRGIVKNILGQMCSKYDCNYSVEEDTEGIFAGLYNDFSVHENDTGEIVL